MEVPVPCRGNIYLWLEIGYPFFVWNSKTRKVWLICSQRGGVRSGCYPRGARKDQSAAPGSCLVKLLDRAKMCSRDRPTLPFCLCHAYLLSTTATGIGKIPKG